MTVEARRKEVLEHPVVRVWNPIAGSDFISKVDALIAAVRSEATEGPRYLDYNDSDGKKETITAGEEKP